MIKVSQYTADEGVCFTWVQLKVLADRNVFNLVQLALIERFV